MSVEIWKDIKNYEGYYQVSNYGKIISLDRYVVNNKNGGTRLIKSKIMKLTEIKGRKGSERNYFVVNLRRNGTNEVCLVHRVVAETFIPNVYDLPTINHKDGNKQNNNVENLEWATYSYNNQHAIDNQLRNPRGLGIIQLDLSGNFIARYKSASEAARITGFGRGSIVHCLCNRRENHNGYVWKYADTVRSNDYPCGEYGG